MKLKEKKGYYSSLISSNNFLTVSPLTRKMFPSLSLIGIFEDGGLIEHSRTKDQLWSDNSCKMPPKKGKGGGKQDKGKGGAKGKSVSSLE